MSTQLQRQKLWKKNRTVQRQQLYDGTVRPLMSEPVSAACIDVDRPLISDPRDAGAAFVDTSAHIPSRRLGCLLPSGALAVQAFDLECSAHKHNNRFIGSQR